MKKRVLSLLMSVVMLISLLPATTRAAETENTLTGDVRVGSAAELAALGGKDVEGNITLTADIDMSDTAMEPIRSLKGCFNGDGKTIANLSLTGGKGSYNWQTGTVYVNTGLIGELDGSVINVKLTGVSITGVGQYNNAGALAGRIADGSTSRIDNCTVSGAIASTAGNGSTLLGGLVGMLSGSTDEHTALTIHNCVSQVALTGAASGYAGGLIGSAQYYSDVTITKCAVLGDLSGRGNSAGMIGYINSGSATLSLSDSYLGGKVDGSKKYGIAYNLSALSSLTCTGFYYDSEKNKGAYSWESFDMLKTGGYSVKATGKSTAELKALSLDGFAVRAGEFDGYPVPSWTPAAAPDPSTPPAPAFSCTLTFEGAEDGTLTVKHGETGLRAEEDGSYILSEAGDYSYSVAFDEDSEYEDVAETTFTVGEDESEKTIVVTLTRKPVTLTGEGTAESPYRISSARELRAFAERVNGGDRAAAGAWVELTDDIVVPGSWTPLGKNAAFPFRGSFDGGGHSVTVTVDDPGLSYFGFFGCLESEIDRDSADAMDDQPTVVVRNLTVNGTIYCSEPYAYVGGIAGRARGKVRLENCVNNATISSLARGSAGVGGLIGGYDDGVDYVYENIRMTLEGCENKGLINVTGSNTSAMVGGLVGSNANCIQVKNSANRATVNAPGCTVGGLLGQAGYQTGDFKPSIADSSNTGALIGAEGRTNNLYGKGTIGSGGVTNSGSNSYTGGVSEDELLAESQKYGDVLAVPSTAEAGDAVTLLKTGESAAEGITVVCSQGEKDTNRAYLRVENGILRLAKKNTTGKVIEATATITWRMAETGRSFSKPVTVNIYPAAAGETDAREALMQSIAATYENSSDDWAVFDMAAYAACGFGRNTADTQNYLSLAINELAGSTPLASDRAKAEIIFAALGVDSTTLTPYGTETSYSNAAKLAAMDLGNSHYTAPWVLLAEQAGQVRLTDAQRERMIALLTNSGSLGADGLFFTRWGGETYADPDTTGTALAALAAYADRPEVRAFLDRAVDGLSRAQHSDGSYGNVNSDAMVILGLAALGIDPGADGRFVKNGCSLADALLLYVNGSGDGFTAAAVDSANGTLTQKASALATEQGFRALVALEELDRQTVKAFNIYTLSVTKTDAEGTEEPVESIKPALTPALGEAETPGALPSQSGGSTGTAAGWITVTMRIEPAGSTAWYSGSLRVEEGASVGQAIRAAADNAGLILDIRSGYLRAISCNGVTLGQYDEGPNSGWMYKLNGVHSSLGMDAQTLRSGDSIVFHYTDDYTREQDSEHWSSGGGGAAAEKPEESALLLTDVPGTAWYAGAVRYVYEKGIMTGVSETEFAPESTATRAQIATILYRLAGSPAAAGSGLSDVSEDAWYAAAVRWAVSAGVVTGYADGRFGPDDLVTREQLAAILCRYARTAGYTMTDLGSFAAFTDADEASDWASGALRWALGSGLINGTSATTLSPKATATRAQIAAILQRFCALSADASGQSAAQTAYNGAVGYLTAAVTAPRYGGAGGEWTVLALARGGVDTENDYFDKYYAALEQTVRESGGVLSERRYTEYSRVILALSALGKDAREVAGCDLTYPLGDFDKTMAQGVNGAIYALLALDSRSYPVPQNAEAKTQATRQMYVDAILAAALADGGWSFLGDDADPDLTGMALQALANYRTQNDVQMAVNRAIVRLSAMQSADGGFSAWGTENAESCAQVLLALNALGLRTDDSRFVKNGRSVLDALVTYQNADGGFCHARGGETDLMASEQAACALAALARAGRGESRFYQMPTLTERAA